MLQTSICAIIMHINFVDCSVKKKALIGRIRIHIKLIIMYQSINPMHAKNKK